MQNSARKGPLQTQADGSFCSSWEEQTFPEYPTRSHCTAIRAELWGRSNARSSRLWRSVPPKTGSVSSLLQLRVWNAKETEQTHHKADTYPVLLLSCFLCILKSQNAKQTQTAPSIYGYSLPGAYVGLPYSASKRRWEALCISGLVYLFGEEYSAMRRL